MSAIFNRQQGLPIQVPEKITIIGVGGVGSWAAWDFASIGVQEIILVDDDVIEEHNLNRTPFKTSQIGDTKVAAMVELIAERRPSCMVIPHPVKYEDLSDPAKEDIAKTVVIDCRDDTSIIGDFNTPITGGYDGTKCTIHVNPNYKKIFGDEPIRYSVTPSYIIPPQILAAAITNWVCVERHKNPLPETIISFDCADLLGLLKEMR